MNTGYPFPDTPLHPGRVEWTGSQFAVGGRALRVLCYDQSQSHWSDELTKLHEEEGGAAHPIDVASRRMALETARRWAPSRAPVVLDVGCSSGYLLEILRDAFPDGTVLGADYIPELLERVADRLPGIPILQFDLRQCPLPDASIDVVTCLNVLEHIDDDREALRHLHRILRPGGVAHVEVPAGPHLYDIYDEHLMHHRRYTLAGLTARATDVGFEVIKATHLGVLVYPAFAFVKRRNRRLLQRPEDEKRRRIAAQIRSTGHSWPLSVAMRIEAAIGRWMTFPLGIRCVAVLRRRI